MSPDLFYDVWFFFTRHDAEKLRLVCRAFDALCTGLRDVHGYKLQIDRLWIEPDDWSTSVPSGYCATVKAYGRSLQIKGNEEELAAKLKAALFVSLLRYGSIHVLALSESLCGESVAFFSGVSVETMDLAKGKPSTYYETLSSSKLCKFLLSFNAIRELRFRTSFLDDHLTDDFIIRCRSKRMKTLHLGFDAELRLQEASEDDVLQRFRALSQLMPTL